MNRRATGSRYEKIAAAYLIEAGYEIIQQNYRFPHGEIDIVAKHGEYLVFIEVKYRSGSSMGDPLEAVDCRKQKRIRNTARVYLYEHGYSEEQPCRFDVVAILGKEIRLIQNAF